MPEPDVTAALKYTGDGAPQVVAAGKGHLAATILARAREAGVPVHRDPELASSLAKLSLGQEVPVAMWTAVRRGPGLGLWAPRRRAYPKSVMEDIGSAPDTGFVR